MLIPQIDVATTEPHFDALRLFGRILNDYLHFVFCGARVVNYRRKDGVYLRGALTQSTHLNVIELYAPEERERNHGCQSIQVRMR